MKVALVQPSWTPHSEARLRHAAVRLAAEDVHLEVLTLAAHQSDYQWPTPLAANTALFPESDYWRLGYRELKLGLTSALEASKPDVVVLPGWSFRESLSGLGWAIRTSTRRVLVSDSQKIDSERRFTTEMSKRLLVRNFDAALVGGSPHISYLVSLGFEPSRCFPGCDVIDNGFFRVPPRAPVRDEPTLLSCIRLLPRKNVPMILDVLSRVEGWRWAIAGDGPERGSIGRCVSELGLGNRVDLLGHVSYQDLPLVYASADAYIQPSLSEPWGLAVNEAMAAGLPVLVSDRCGCSADLVVEGSNGFRFDPTDSTSVEGALKGMLAVRDRWPDMGRASEGIISKWDLDLYAANLIRTCRKAVAGNRGSGLMGRALGRLL